MLVVFLDSLGIIIESIIRPLTDNMILNFGHGFKLMKPHCKYRSRKSLESWWFSTLVLVRPR
jgi:hypothetical protein